MLFRVLILILAVMLAGCQTVQYVAARDVPLAPSFTVVTVSTTYSNLRYASELEKGLINLGVSVVRPPAVIRRTESSGNITAEASEANLRSQDSKLEIADADSYSHRLIDRYHSYGETKASYIIEVAPNGSGFKVIKKNTSEILAVIDSISSPKYSIDELSEIFSVLGFQVRKFEVAKSKAKFVDDDVYD